MQQSWDTDREQWQRIENARPIPDRRRQRIDRQPVPVRVRLVWECDGAQWIDTRAIDWVGRDVLVELDDRRWRLRGVWVEAGDVERV